MPSDPQPDEPTWDDAIADIMASVRAMAYEADPLLEGNDIKFRTNIQDIDAAVRRGVDAFLAQFDPPAPAAVTPEPAGPRVWVASKHGYRFREDEHGRIEAAPAYDPDNWGTTVWKSMLDVERELGPLAEVPSVPPAEPGAGA